MAVPNMIVTLVANTTKFAKGMAGASTTLEKFGTSAKWVFGSFASLVAGAAVAFGKFAWDAIGDASNLEQAVGGSKAVFGEFAKDIQAFSKDAAKNVGLSMEQYQRIAAMTGTLLKGAGVPVDQLATKTDKLITLAADLAATYGGTVEEAATSMNAALRKEYEPIRRFGISLSQAQVQQRALADTRKKSINDLTQQELLLATQNLLYEQGAAAMGQFSRESDTLQNKQQVVKAQWENISATLGDKLLPIASEFTDALSKMLEDPAFVAALDNLVSKFEDFGTWLGSEQGIHAVNTLSDAFIATADAIVVVIDKVNEAIDAFKTFFGLQDKGYGGQYGGGVRTYPGAPTVNPNIPTPTYKAPVTVNVTGLTPTAKIGATVMSAIQNAQRLGAR